MKLLPFLAAVSLIASPPARKVQKPAMPLVKQEAHAPVVQPPKLIDIPVEFKGVPVGADMTATITKLTAESEKFGVVGPSRKGSISTFFVFRTSIAKARAKAIYRFVDTPDGARLGDITLTFDSGDFLIVADALAQKYGDPTADDESDFQTVGGVSTTSGSRVWVCKTGTVKVIQRWGKLTQGCVKFESAEFGKSVSEGLQANRAENAKDM